MAKIREDLEGVTFVRTPAGVDVMLRAGDKVPKGVTVGEHLIHPKATTSTPPDSTPPGTQPATGGGEGGDSAGAPENDPASGDATSDETDSGADQGSVALTVPPQSGNGSGLDKWQEYAACATEAAGLKIELAATATRADIISALAAAGIATE